MGRYKVVDVIDRGPFLEFKIEPVPHEALREQFEQLMAQEMSERFFESPENLCQEVRVIVQRILDQLSQ